MCKIEMNIIPEQFDFFCCKFSKFFQFINMLNISIQHLQVLCIFLKGIPQLSVFSKQTWISFYHNDQIAEYKTLCIIALYIMIPLPLQRGEVTISHGQLKEQVSLQMRAFTQWGVRRLLLQCNYRETVIQEITHIHFTALTCLSLGGSAIKSIEGLYWVQMPHLQTIFACQQHCFSKRKAAWPALIDHTEDNRVGDGKSLTVGCFPKLRQLYVYCTWREDKSTFTEQCFPATMQAASLAVLCINKHKFCFDRCIIRVLQQRWSQVKIN